MFSLGVQTKTMVLILDFLFVLVVVVFVLRAKISTWAMKKSPALLSRFARDCTTHSFFKQFLSIPHYVWPVPMFFLQLSHREIVSDKDLHRYLLAAAKMWTLQVRFMSSVRFPNFATRHSAAFEKSYLRSPRCLCGRFLPWKSWFCRVLTWMFRLNFLKRNGSTYCFFQLHQRAAPSKGSRVEFKSGN